jgi:NTE family protein
LAADYYDRILFHRATFADLGPNLGHPRLILNATDMANGEQFPFVPERFELIGSDLGSYRISRAIASASAFPLLLSPVTLKNYRDVTAVSDPDIVRREAAAQESERNLLVQNTILSYSDYRENPYIHLIDGGTSDNLGLESLIDADFQFGGMERLIEETLHSGAPHRFVLIVVNASVHHQARASKSEAVPGITNELWRLADNFQEHSDVQYLDLLKVALGRWKAEAAAGGKLPGTVPEYYLVSVDLAELHGGANGSFFDNIPTNFHLPFDTINRIVEAGGTLLKESPDYQRLLSDLSKSP